MIADDCLDEPLLERIPEAVAISPFTDRRAAFVASISVSNVLCCKGKVMETSLGGDLDAGILRGADEWDAFGSRHVDDMQLERGSDMRKGEDLLDGIRLKCPRARG
jgi:hypothetical protein